MGNASELDAAKIQTEFAAVLTPASHCACYDLPRMNTTPQRENWDGHPVDLGDAWVLRKGDKVARLLAGVAPARMGAAVDHDRSAPLAGVPLVR